MVGSFCKGRKSAATKTTEPSDSGHGGRCVRCERSDARWRCGFRRQIRWTWSGRDMDAMWTRSDAVGPDVDSIGTRLDAIGRDAIPALGGTNCREFWCFRGFGASRRPSSWSRGAHPDDCSRGAYDSFSCKFNVLDVFNVRFSAPGFASLRRAADGQRAASARPVRGQCAASARPVGGQCAASGRPAGGQRAATGRPAGGQRDPLHLKHFSRFVVFTTVC